ncbi:MAG: nucleotidyl transferase AbiEii/AbiGii toxin family protein [Thermoproteota archaeon]|jgi:predicted nucleotidyltransferase component of viral defense system
MPCGGWHKFKRKVILEPIVKRIGWNHPELPAFDVIVMREEEILAEKVRAIFTRMRARDIYDVFFLIQKGIKPNLELINEKLNYCGLSFSYQDFVKRLNSSKGYGKVSLLS